MSYHHNFFNTDKAAITRKAIPAHHKLPVRNQTIKATIAAGISTRSKRMMNSARGKYKYYLKFRHV